MVERADRGKHKVMEEAPSEMADVVRLYWEYKLLVIPAILKKPIPKGREYKISLTLFLINSNVVQLYPIIFNVRLEYKVNWKN